METKGERKREDRQAPGYLCRKTSPPGIKLQGTPRGDQQRRHKETSGNSVGNTSGKPNKETYSKPQRIPPGTPRVNPQETLHYYKGTPGGSTYTTYWNPQDTRTRKASGKSAGNTEGSTFRQTTENTPGETCLTAPSRSAHTAQSLQHQFSESGTNSLKPTD